MNGRLRIGSLLRWVILAMLPAAASPAAAPRDAQLQALDDALPGTLINDPTRLDWPSFGTGLTSQPVRDDTIPGGKAAIRFAVPRAGATLYETGASVPLSMAIAAGDDIVVAFYARTLDSDAPSGKGVIGARVQLNEPPYPGFGDSTISIGSNWQLYEMATKATVAIPAGKGVVGFQLSGARQTIEIGQTIVLAGTTSLGAAPAGPAAASAAQLLPQLVGKGQLLNRLDKAGWTFAGAGATQEILPTPSIPGTGGTAMRVTTPAAGANAYDVVTTVPIDAAIREGDILLVAVLARSAGERAASLGIRVQANEPPYPGFAENMLSLAPAWRLLQLRTQARMDIAAGKAAVALHFATAAQSIDVGQVFVLKQPPAGEVGQ
jgi:hypothetical protein